MIEEKRDSTFPRRRFSVGLASIHRPNCIIRTGLIEYVRTRQPPAVDGALVRLQEAMTARHQTDQPRFRIATASLHCILAALFLLLGGCVGGRETPGVP